MVCVNAMLLLAFCYINLNYLYTDELIDMANRVAHQFEDTMDSHLMEEYFNDSRTDVYRQQLNDLNKYSRPEKVRIFVVFPNGVTSQYNENEERVTFELLPPEFFPIFRKTVLHDELTTEYPNLSNRFKRWTVAVPIHGGQGVSGGMIITSIFMEDVIRRLIPVFAAIGIALILSFVFLMNAQKGFAEILESPLNNITKALETWSLSGFTSGAAAKLNDEIGMLARTLDEVALKLKEEQKRRDEDDENRRNFFNNVSHELKTPVAALRAQVELLNDGLAAEEELPEYYESILQNTVYLQEIVEDLLTLSRLQTPSFKLDLELCCVAEILDDVYQSMSPVAADKGILMTLEQKLIPEMTMVMGNYTRLRQLVLIFTENSIKYSPTGTHILLSLEEADQELLLTVQDEGMGIPKGEMSNVFRHQYRASNTGETEGTGLGLTIAHEIAGRLNFRLEMDSEENCGTNTAFQERSAGMCCRILPVQRFPALLLPLSEKFSGNQ